MITAPTDVISDAELAQHFYGNFGQTTPRDIVNEGVVKYALGYSAGHTQMSILVALKLIRKPDPGKYASTLTKKGLLYLRTLISFSDIMETIRNRTAGAKA